MTDAPLGSEDNPRPWPWSDVFEGDVIKVSTGKAAVGAVYANGFMATAGRCRMALPKR